MKNIRNFSIIAHIDHGKSTLADRMLEVTSTISERKMRNQVLDKMDLERERGITIKMQPVRMNWKSGDKEFILNLIDTPGHIDFSYEVSRALKAVEGVVLLVDATQGIQAQTLSVLHLAREQDLVVIPVLSKIDSPLARTEDIKADLSLLLEIDEDEIRTTSGKTGEGVADLLDVIVNKVPAPDIEGNDLRALIFDFQYSDHRGIVLFVRIIEGVLKRGEKVTFAEAGEQFTALETGIFTPEEETRDALSVGEIGYIITGIKKPGIVGVGDTVLSLRSNTEALPGYREPRPVIWASVYPESQDDLALLRQSLERLRLMDSSLSYEEESSGVMGRGFRCGFLGMLHMEIITERLRREFDVELIVTLPTTVYEVTLKDGAIQTVYTPTRFPNDGEAAGIREQWVRASILAPSGHLSGIMPLLHEHEGMVVETETMPDGRTQIIAEMPLREMMRNFFDKLKNISSGFASLSYEQIEMRDANVTRLDILIAEELSPAFSRIVSKRRLEEEAREMVVKLKDMLPKQLFVVKIQAKSQGRIIAGEKISAMRKDVTGYLYGGDITRKKKLLEKQKKGKKKALARGRVHIPHEVFMKVMRSE
ncbi:elongation factor 4 [bacterium]|nr:elongation factor 4 [bacterium]|tara:strand:- start:10005 stop:11786 length:1782 start_codon:yes stop_codon:yes gene_type:complete